MSLLSKIFGRRSFDEEHTQALRLVQQGELGLAKLAFERALERASDQTQETLQSVSKKIDECCDGIAVQRAREAARLLAEGELALALGEFEGAAETAVSAAVKADIEQQAEQAVRGDARKKADDVVPQSDDERFETLSGSWEDAQYDELTGYGTEVKHALLAAHEGQTAAALEVLEAQLSQAQTPRYLLYEVGRLRLLADDNSRGQDALAAFVKTMGATEGGETRLSAHMELAQLHHDAGNADLAIAQYDAAIEALPDDSRPYLAMAAYLRREGHAAEAVEILHGAAMVEGRDRPQWMIAEQLGLAYADLSRDAQAVELLEDAISQLAERGRVMLPIEGTIRLCGLHEKAGNLARAVDLWTLLAEGKDGDNRFHYQLQAARGMERVGLHREALQMLQRASEIAPTDAETHAEVAALRAKIEGNS